MKKDPTDGHYYRVKQQIPDALQATRQHFNKVVAYVQDKNKEKPNDQRVPFYFQGSHLFVGGRRVREPVDPPTLSSLLNITSDQQKILDDINLQPLAHGECEGSKFYACATRAYGFTSIEKVYLWLRQQHMTADHIMLGYRLADPDSPKQCVDGSCHDGESHGDIILAQVIAESRLKNIAVFVMRYSGSTPLQGLRLKTIGDCGNAALHKIQFPTEDTNADSNSSPEHSASIAPNSMPDHPYGRSSPHNLTGHGGIHIPVGRQLKPVFGGKRPCLDYASTMAYSLDYQPVLPRNCFLLCPPASRDHSHITCVMNISEEHAHGPSPSTLLTALIS